MKGPSLVSHPRRTQSLFWSSKALNVPALNSPLIFSPSLSSQGLGGALLGLIPAFSSLILLALAMFHAPVALLRPLTAPRKAMVSMNILVGLNWLVQPCSLAA